VFWLQTALKNEKSGAARADSTRPSWADCGVFSLTGLLGAIKDANDDEAAGCSLLIGACCATGCRGTGPGAH
jgi:hypothetical protein